MSADRAVWQLAAGPASRSYPAVLLRFGVGLLGPGDPGPWSAHRSDGAFEGALVRQFATEFKKGDIVLLRAGATSVCAIGLVASDYLYLEQFDDVNGWDLQHARRVRWFELPAPWHFEENVSGGYRNRFSRVENVQVAQHARSFVSSSLTYWQTAPLPDLPPIEPPLEQTPPSLQALVAEIHDLCWQYWDSAAFGDFPSEQELVAHFVVPFFRALGWPPEHIAVEWHDIDVAVFRRLPRDAGNCQLVVEAKRLGEGLETVFANQAKGYVERLGLPIDVVVTDGVRYRLYESASGFKPTAYANILRPKQSAQELFEKLKRP